jgi:subtilisin family serine protease
VNLASVVIIALAQSSSLAPLDLGPNGQVIGRWQHINAIAAEVDAADIPRIAADPSVVRIDRDVAGSGSLVTSVPMIGGDAVRLAGYTGKGITVAVIDSGVTASHPDVAGRVVDEQCFCRVSDGSGCCPNGAVIQAGPGAARDDHGHGTNVTGILASRGAVSSPGVAPEVSIVAVKVLDRNNRFSGTAQILSALDWIITTHPEVRVINMSLGTDATFATYCDSTFAYTIAFAEAIRTLRNRGTMVFVSSGNDGSSTAMEAPACVQPATSVGAVYDANFGDFSFGTVCSTTTAAMDRVTCFTNSNGTLDLLAPGTRIVSDGITGGTSTFTGTSQASPHAAGAAAVLMAMKPGISAGEIEALLKSTGKPVVDERNGVVTPRINLFAAAGQLVKPAVAPPRRRSIRH